MSAQSDDWKINGPKALPEKLPAQTVYPPMLSLGVTLICFGLVTSPIMSLCGLIVFVISVVGWIEDLRND